MPLIVEELAAKFGLEVDEAAFARAETLLHGLSTGFMGIIAAVGGAVVGLTAIVAKTGHVGDEAAATAEKLGVTTQALQGLEFAAVMFDATAEGLSTGLKFLGKNAAEAAAGSDELKKAFASAGVGIYGAGGKLKPTDDLLASLADKFQSMGEGHGPKKLELAIKLLGRSGAELIPMLNKGSKGIAEMRAEAESLGLVMSAETIKASEEWDDSTKRLGFTFVGLRNAIGGPLIRSFTEYVKAISKFVAKNKEAIAAPIIKFAKGLGAAIRFLAGDTKAASLVWFGFATLLASKVVNALLAVKTGFDILSLASLKSAAASVRAWIAATGPILLLAAAIALIAEDLYSFANGDDSVLGRIVAWTSKINPTDNNMIKAIKLIGSALFDLGDDKAWSKFVEGGTRAAKSINEAFANVLNFNWIGEAIVKAIVKALGGGALWDKLNAPISGNTQVPFTQRLTEAVTGPTIAARGVFNNTRVGDPLPGGQNAPRGVFNNTRVGDPLPGTVVHIDARGNPAEMTARIEGAVKSAIQSQNQKAAAAVEGG